MRSDISSLSILIRSSYSDILRALQYELSEIHLLIQLFKVIQLHGFYIFRFSIYIIPHPAYRFTVSCHINKILPQIFKFLAILIKWNVNKTVFKIFINLLTMFFSMYSASLILFFKSATEKHFFSIVFNHILNISERLYGISRTFLGGCITQLVICSYLP